MGAGTDGVAGGVVSGTVVGGAVVGVAVKLDPVFVRLPEVGGDGPTSSGTCESRDM